MTSPKSDKSASIVRIVDDQLSIREAVADLLASVGLETRSYSSAAQFLENDDATSPGCVVLDVRMPDMSGFDLLDALNTRAFNLPTVFVTGHGDIAMAVRAMKAGAIDFLSKPFDDQQLIDAVNTANRVDSERRKKSEILAKARERLKSLSAGEQDVLELVLRGLRNKQIAVELAISEITVKVRRSRLQTKLGILSTPELVRLYDRAKS